MVPGNTAAFELTVSSCIEELTTVHDFVGKAVAAFDLEEELAHWLELSVNEGAINAMRHGNGLDPSKTVFLRISGTGQAIEIIVEDQGPGFDLAEVPDPRDAENLLKPGGRGILIIRSFMDTVEITGGENGGNRLRMVKQLDAEHPE